MTFHNRRNHQRPRPSFSENVQAMMATNNMSPEDDDKSSLEAAAEAAAKVNAMLIAKGMLKPNQLHSVQNVVTKKIGGPNSLVVAEVEINYLPLPCRNTLTRGGTQEEISKASGASVTTRGRYMTEEEKSRHPRDRCLYLNIQATKKESVDVAVQKIDIIIKTMAGDKMNKKGGPGFHGGPRFHSPPKHRFNNPRFEGGKNQPPPLMSLPSPQQLQHPPPQLPQMVPQHQMQIPPPPQPGTVQVTVMQEKLYVGLEHAPPNFDTKNKLLGPGGSFIQHIQIETGTNVSLRGKGSGCLDMSEADTYEPMHIRLEHSSLGQLQEAKKLAENLIQTVQQSYVSFQQALAALPPSMPTGLITGIPQQPPLVEHQQLTMAQSGLATIPTVQEQSLHAIQPQALANTAAGQAVVIQPTSMTLQVPMMTALPVSAAQPTIIQQPAPFEMVGQQQVIINHPPGPPAQAIVQQVIPAPGQPQPQPVPPPQLQPGSGAPMPPQAFAPVQQTVQLVSQAPPLSIIQQQPAPAIIAQPPPQVFTPLPQPSASVAPHSSVVYTVASSSGHPYYSSGEENKRRFREEKDDKIPENLLGYQHGPPHLVNLVRSSPPPQPQPVPPPPMSQPPHIFQQQQQPPQQAQPLPGVVMSHMPPHGMEQHQHQQQPPTAFLQPPPQAVPLMEGQQFPPPPQGPPGPPPLGPPPPQHQFVPASSAGFLPPPPHHIYQMPPPMSSPSLMTSVSPSHVVTSSPNGELRPHSMHDNDKSLMPPPPPPSSLGSPTEDGIKEDSNQSEDDDKEVAGKRKSNGFNSEPEKKKIKGILKNKQDQIKQEAEEKEQNHSDDLRAEDIDERRPTQEMGGDGDKHHPASPQYQGQPLRYPSMSFDPNVPPQLQDMGMQQQPRPPHPGMHPPLPNIITSHTHPHHHHLVQQPSELPPPHFQHQHPQPQPPPPQHIHIEQGGPRLEGPPPPPGTQIVIEHQLPPGTPIHFTHHPHRPPGPPTSISLEQQHAMAGPPPPRQILIEHSPHPHPAQLDQPPLQHELPSHPSQHPVGMPPPPQPMQGPPPPPHQEVLEFEVHPNRPGPGPPPPGFQTFEHISVSEQPPPPQQAAIIQQQQGPPTVIAISSAQHFMPAMSSAPPPQVSFAIASSQTGAVPVYSQPILQQQPLPPPPPQPQPHHQQHPPPQQQMMSAPPNVAPQPSFCMSVPPTSSPHFQAQFGHPAQAVQPGQQMVAPPPIASQHQFHQPQPQGVQYWAS